MTNIDWYIKEKHNEELLACFKFPLPTNKNNYQAFKNLFQIFLIYKFQFKKTGESFNVLRRKIVQKQSFRGFLLTRCSQKFRKVHRKTPIPEPPFK